MKYANNILETIGNTPLVKINHITKDLPCTVLAKVEYFNPGSSCKDRMALKMVEDAEKALFTELAKITPVVEPLLAAKDYTTALSQLAALRAPVDAFFDNVMVMADDAELKANRLRLLAQLRDLFTRVADVSVLQH